MNSIQRVLAAMTFGKAEYGEPDRVPVLPVPLMQGALVNKCTVEEYFSLPAARIAQSQIELNELLDGIPDGVAGIPHVIEDVTAFGVSLRHYYPNSTPGITKMLLRSYSDIDSLNVPAPERSPQLRKTRDTIAELAKRIGSEKVVIGACIAPFSLPSMLMGTAKWMRLLYTPELRDRYLNRLLHTCSAFVVQWANMQLDVGAHLVVFADGMASATMIPPRMFQTYALPITQETISKVNGMVAYEFVGAGEPIIDMACELGAIALLIGEEDNIRACKETARGRVGLIGNVNNMKMRRWSSARVSLRAKQALMDGMEGYGFALANQGPEIPFDVPVDSIRALVETVVRYGNYAAAKASDNLAVGCSH